MWFIWVYIIINMRYSMSSYFNFIFTIYKMYKVLIFTGLEINIFEVTVFDHCDKLSVLKAF